jgi:cytochrome c biogenesis protein CcmG, thiol:disulfide interchange protein DsbE
LIDFCEGCFYRPFDQFGLIRREERAKGVQENQMTKLFVWLPASFLSLGIVLSGPIVAAAPIQDAGRQANDKLNAAEELNRKGQIEEAAVAYREAVGMFEKALAQKPGDKSFLQDLKYCLDRPGYIRIIKANDLQKSGQWESAARLFDGAIAAYREALAKYPEERNFQQNLTYARRNGGTARFQVLLQSKEAAPDFSLPNLGEGRLSLADLRGKVVLLEFMAGWCPSCKDSLLVLQDVMKQFAGRPVEIVLMAMDKVPDWGKSGSDLRSIQLAKNLPFRAAWADEETFFGYGAFPSIPAVVLIDARGRLARRIDYNDQNKENFVKMIEAALQAR